MIQIRQRAYYFGMSVSEFNESNLNETLTYIYQRSLFEQKRSEDDWMIMRWQSALIVNMKMPKGKSIKPEDLFTLGNEKPKEIIPIDSEEAKQAFDLLQQKYLSRWQQ